ncbi:MAG: GH3 auxin-responsive promoter [Cytophagales bacterium]|nr:MAG: GH3 auxin-responsive promoter [Cytophagales bacterium]
MNLLGSLLNRGIKIRKIIELDTLSPFELQRKELKKLIRKSRLTSFGFAHSFSEIFLQFRSSDKEKFYQYYCRRVPVFNYNKIYAEWWHRCKEGESDVTWPGRVKYFALSSGTSESSSKYIPITKDMVKSNKRASIRQIFSLAKYNLPDEIFEKGILMLGGSTDLKKEKNFYEGDLSGIQASKIPFWFQMFYKPGRKIAKNRDWNKKLEEITLKAKDWDIGFVCGVPAWIQLLMEKIIDHYQVKTIHDIWPNLTIFVHGGVSFAPYKKGFEKLLSKPLIYIETYLASEGFIAMQNQPDSHTMQLILNNGIFYEFVPFNDENFDNNGDMVPNPQTLMIHQVEEGKEYALLLSTNAGTWRYLIGDVIRFTSLNNCELIISGRTKHFLSLVGEHLSVENMNAAIFATAEELNISVKEYTVSGIHHKNMFAHSWYIGSDDTVSSELFRDKLDHHLQLINDDYKTERIAALKDVFVKIVPTDAFYSYLKYLGREGGQTKFPRVMKKNAFDEWEKFIKEKTTL